jgi:hypothetical protein
MLALNTHNDFKCVFLFSFFLLSFCFIRAQRFDGMELGGFTRRKMPKKADAGGHHDGNENPAHGQDKWETQ